jgi:hypothetical protein
MVLRTHGSLLMQSPNRFNYFARVTKVVLHPMTLLSTDASGNEFQQNPSLFCNLNEIEKGFIVLEN